MITTVLKNVKKIPNSYTMWLYNHILDRMDTHQSHGFWRRPRTYSWVPCTVRIYLEISLMSVQGEVINQHNRNGLCQNINTDNQCDETDVISVLGSLKPATNEKISKIIHSSASTSFDLDPIPTCLLKLCLSELLPVITYIINLSLSTSNVRYELKLAPITPLLKKYCWIPRF